MLSTGPRKTTVPLRKVGETTVAGTREVAKGNVASTLHSFHRCIILLSADNKHRNNVAEENCNSAHPYARYSRRTVFFFFSFIFFTY